MGTVILPSNMNFAFLVEDKAGGLVLFIFLMGLREHWLSSTKISEPQEN